MSNGIKYADGQYVSEQIYHLKNEDIAFFWK